MKEEETKEPLPPSLREKFPSSFLWKQEWVRESNYQPPPQGWRPKASQRAGLRFENSVGKILLQLSKSNSFSYHFQKAFTGPEGIRIPDHFWLPVGPSAPQQGFVFETKLTWKPSAEIQALSYASLLSSFFQLPFCAIVIAKNLTPSTPLSSLTTFEGLSALRSEGPWTLHAMWPDEVLKHLEREELSKLPEGGF